MILKVRNSHDEGWSYFECQVVHSKYRAFGKIEGQGEMIVLLENKELKKDVVVKLLNLETAKSHFRTILTDRTCYILNNEGKTIERL